jgi:hypothetical protein
LSPRIEFVPLPAANDELRDLTALLTETSAPPKPLANRVAGTVA